MALKTKETLQRMFQESRERQKKKKEQQSKLKLEARKEKYKEINKRVKEALENEKRKMMDNLSALAPKRSENVRKTPHIDYSIYHSNLIERETSEDDLYTLEELKNIETLYPNETGRINWTKWNELIAKNRQ